MTNFFRERKNKKKPNKKRRAKVLSDERSARFDLTAIWTQTNQTNQTAFGLITLVLVFQCLPNLLKTPTRPIASLHFSLQSVDSLLNTSYFSNCLFFQVQLERQFVFERGLFCIHTRDSTKAKKKNDKQWSDGKSLRCKINKNLKKKLKIKETHQNMTK